MRRNQFVGLVFTSLCLWAAATYYLFLHRPVSRADETSRVENHLDELEERLRAQFADNERLLADLKKLVHKQQAVPPYASDKVPGIAHADAEVAAEVVVPAEADANHKPAAVAAEVDSELPVDQEGHHPLDITHDQFVGPLAPLNPVIKESPVPPKVPAVPLEVSKKLVIQPPKQPPQQLPFISSQPRQSHRDLQTEQLRALAAGGADRKPAVAVLVLACNRVTVRKCLDQLLAYRPSADLFPIIVSQDCRHAATADTLAAYSSRVALIQQPDQSEIDVPYKEKKFRGYFNIARHYGWALNQTFLYFNFQTAIIVEDDLDVAPDFFEYFSATLPLLHRDPTLWCVSAWNDNGKAALVDENAPDLLYRTDFFPGLGWMLTRETWAELAPKWPASYWDDWVRQPEQRLGRACIRPELSRTRTFGKVGVSNGHFYDKHLKYIKLSDKFVPFTKQDLNYLLKDNYDVEFVRRVFDSPVVTYQELRSGSIVAPGPVRIPYYTKDAFKHTAKMLGLMDDFRSGVPRTGYRGVVSFMYKGRRVYLAPNANWKAYDPSWS